MRKDSHCLLGVLLCTVISNSALGQSRSDMIEQCAQLADLDLPDTTVTAASLEAADQFVPPGEEAALRLPDFCRLEGVISPTVGFEVWLPIAGWNGKLQLVGNGGMAGTISYRALGRALARGYATASTDTGHRAGPIPFDASWASGRMDPVSYTHLTLPTKA